MNYKSNTRMAWTFIIWVSIIVSINAKNLQVIKTSELIGSSNGTFWSDEKAYLKHGEITGIQIASSETLNGFRLRYGNVWGRWHGGTGGVKRYFDISNLTSIRGSQHRSNVSSENYIRSIEFTVNNGEYRIGPFGTADGTGKKYKKKTDGCRLAYMSGYNGYADWLIKIKGVVFNWICDKQKHEGRKIKDTGLVGGKSSVFWSDEKLYYDHGKISSLKISAEKNIVAIRVRYGEVWGLWHGGTGGKVHSFDIENIVSVRGVEIAGNKSLTGYILSMELTSLNGTRYGPFGTSKTGGQKYIKNADHCHVAFISGYSGAVDWLFKLTGIIFHWICNTGTTSSTLLQMINTQVIHP